MLCHWVSSSGHSNFCQYFWNSLPNEMESHLIRHEKFTATTSNLACKKINPEFGDCTFLQSATLQKTVNTLRYLTIQKSNIWDFMSGSYKTCSRNVNLKNTIGELWLGMLVQQVAILFLSTKTSWYDFNRKEGTAEQGLFRYLLMKEWLPLHIMHQSITVQCGM